MLRQPLVAFLLAASLGAVGHACAAEPKDTPPSPVLLDCAVGNEMDDAFALALATADPTIDLLGVTTVSGNAEDRAWIVCRFLSAIGREKIPVAFGRGNQPAREIQAQFQYRYHPAVLYGRTAKPAKQTAVELLRDQLTASEKKPTIVCTGPLTNVAQLLAEHPQVKSSIERILVTGDPTNLARDLPSAKGVLASGIRIDLLPWECGADVRLDERIRQRIFKRCTPLTLQLQTLHELDPGPRWHPAVATVALVSGDAGLQDAFEFVPATVTLNEKGDLKWSESKTAVRVVSNMKREPLVDWWERHLSLGDPVLPREPGNRTTPIDRGGMPNRVHVFEDYETDTERRWWLAGLPKGTSSVPGSSRHCRGMLTMDFDDLQGDTQTMYRAVVFNPVPGPPMGKNPRLSFRCWLNGTDKLRVQIYSLSNGYHRYLSLAELPQEKWLDLAVDMTAARRPDGSGGPLSEGERIDDIQFYADPRAELAIDDVVLYDAAAAGEERPFPKRLTFTGWFDTGKQGKEWPGYFEIPDDSGYFWKAARSIHKEGDRPEIRAYFRGRRLLGKTVQVDFRYKSTSAGPLEVVLRDSTGVRELRARVKELKTGDWQHASVTLAPSPAEKEAGLQELALADELHFILPQAGTLLVDDVLVYEPGR